MSGGEFCGNAARAAALLISQKTNSNTGVFTMSGFDGEVSFNVMDGGVINCKFSNLPITSQDLIVEDVSVKVVDLGGIIHVVLPSSIKFENDESYYKAVHNNFVNILDLKRRSAVGVIWQEVNSDGSIKIHPVVWVKDIDSFFYETACGSGTLAALVACNEKSKEIFQPSNQSIYSERLAEETYLLRSKMEILE
jgi:diaminopimelate epimerase